jgi:hypothetical protein
MAVVPDQLRPAVSELIRQLVAGELTEMLTWVQEYGKSGATLVDQPQEIWSHKLTSVVRTSDGGWHLALPLWTTDESPSDLCAEVVIRPNGAAFLGDVHAL